MPIPPNAVAAAQAVQQQAAHDANSSLRLIAGPGTGKSASIKQRVLWLLNNGQNPKRIFAVSFTRASANDLDVGIGAYCSRAGYTEYAKVSTLHSLGLRILKKAGLLARYPATPLILDNWEMENIFDPEFGKSFPEPDKRRRAEIRRFHEAYWSTGLYNPANYLPPDPPITVDEQTAFNTFHLSRSALYCCVLPGEIVRQCVLEIRSNTIQPATLLDIDHLIVDEFQDLNEMDQELVDGIINGGADAFIAGDDDQSIYSFRYANPSGIQNFAVKYPHTGSYTLEECFRCMPAIMDVANTVIASFPAPQRIPKNMQALFRYCAPNARGSVQRWRFNDGRQEARLIAESCASLIQAGIPATSILILLNNKHALLGELEAAFSTDDVPFEPLEKEPYHDTKPGRFVYALLRIVMQPDDYVAHRTILGIRPNIGIGTIHNIAESVLLNGLNYKNIFYNPLPSGVFKGKPLTAINTAREIFAQISQWDADDNLGQRLAEIQALVSSNFGPDSAQEWSEIISPVPVAATLRGTLSYLTAESEEQQFTVLRAIFEKLGEVAPVPQTYRPGVRIMTMHGAKGLEARVVFIPGLEEETLPGPYRSPYPGLVLEAARLLYVSVTRAQAACILSFAGRRNVNGRGESRHPSRFNAHLGGAFDPRYTALNAAEVQAIVDDCAELLP